MIRFSAGLVVVALGVLIGGGVTSKLSLVYVSIAISVLALIAWAIGVFLKRDELRKELFGDGPELVPAEAGTNSGSSDPGQSAPVPQAGQDHPAHGQDAFNQGAINQGAINTVANTVAFSPGVQVRPTWTPKEPAPRPDQDRVAAPAGGWAATTTPPSGTPQGAPRAWDGDAGSGGTLRSWFDRPAPADTASITDTSGDVDVPADDDDEWPTRYSWLDDDQTDEASESAEATESAEAGESDESVPEAHAPDELTFPDSSKSQGAEAEETEAGEDVPEPPAPTDLGSGETAEAEPSTDEPPADEPPADEPPADEPPAEQESGTRLVTVVPGVPRYHEPNCILIRFMPEDDIQKKSVTEAKAANCTPCAACQPED